MSEEKKNVKQEKAAVPKRTGKNSTPVPVAYIGPSIRGAVQTNTVYNNGLPDVLERNIQKCPVFGSLIVPVTGLSAAKKALKDKSSALYACYEKAERIIKEAEGC